MRFTQLLVLILLSLFSTACGILFYVGLHTSVDLTKLESSVTIEPTILLDDQGNEWARFSQDKRAPVAISEMPTCLIHAFIAAEDHEFFNHRGISIRGIVRSTLVNIYNRKIVQGASTITQQLVKLLYLSQQRTFKRKIKEQVMAFVVEHQCTKEHILQAYLNNVCFGCGIFGVEAAAQRFWGKSAADITIHEAAALASIVRSPQRYCPLLHPERTEQRRNIVLKSMHQLHFINEEEFITAKEIPCSVINQDANCCAPHLRETIRMHIEECLGREQLYNGGLIVQTTLNQTMQAEAKKAFENHVAHLRTTQCAAIDGALLSIEAFTGAIKALIGGYDFQTSQFNRAKAKRQFGSIVKPALYAAALIKGASMTDVEIDESFTLTTNGKPWSPLNYHHKFDGPMTRAYALTTSNNIVAIKTMLNYGIDTFINLLIDMGIKGPIDPYPSLALGCIDRTLYEAVGMMNVFANAGVYKEPYAITWIKNKWGVKIWQAKPEKRTVLPANISDQIAVILGIATQRTERRFSKTPFPFDVIGKTGTNNDCRVGYFIGSTPMLTTGISLACDDNRSIGKLILGSATAFPVWRSFNRAVGSTPLRFTWDPGLKEVVVDGLTGLPVHSFGSSHIFRILVPHSHTIARDLL